MSETDDKKVMTPEFRASFVHVFRPQDPFQAGGDPKYGLTMLFPKGADLSKVKAAAKAAIVEKWGPDKSKWPSNLRLPFRDQGEKADKFDGYEEGAIFINATSKMKPGLVDAQVNDIIDETEFYSGCYARATIRAFAYDTKGNRGVGFGLQNVQKLRDGDPLGGRTRPEDDFSPTEGEPISDDDDLPDAQPAKGGAAADMLD